MLIAAVAPWFVLVLQHEGDPQRATGINALVFMGLEKLASPLFWMLAIPLFASSSRQAVLVVRHCESYCSGPQRCWCPR